MTYISLNISCLYLYKFNSVRTLQHGKNNISNLHCKQSEHGFQRKPSVYDVIFQLNKDFAFEFT